MAMLTWGSSPLPPLPLFQTSPPCPNPQPTFTGSPLHKSDSGSTLPTLVLCHHLLRPPPLLSQREGTSKSGHPVHLSSSSHSLRDFTLSVSPLVPQPSYSLSTGSIQPMKIIILPLEENKNLLLTLYLSPLLTNQLPILQYSLQGTFFTFSSPITVLTCSSHPHWSITELLSSPPVLPPNCGPLGMQLRKYVFPYFTPHN